MNLLRVYPTWALVRNILIYITLSEGWFSKESFWLAGNFVASQSKFLSENGRHRSWLYVAENAYFMASSTLQWRHNERNGVSNHRRPDRFRNRLFRRRSKKHQRSSSLAFLRGDQWPVTGEFLSQTRKMFPFDDVIMKNIHRLAPFMLCLNPYWLIVDYNLGADFNETLITFLFHKNVMKMPSATGIVLNM